MADQNKKSLIYTEDDFSDGFPPRPPFVGIVKAWDADSKEFPNEKTGGTRESRRLILFIESQTSADMNTVDPTTTDGETIPGGILVNAVKMSKAENSVYAAWRKKATAAMSQVTGKADYKLDPDDLVGVPLLFAEVDKKNFVYGDFGVKRHPLFIAGPAPTDWKNHVPADLATQRAAVMEKLRANQRANQGSGAGEGASGLTPVDLGTTAPSAITAPTALDLGTHRSRIVAFLDGKKTSDLFSTINKELADVPEEIRKGLFAGSVQGQLQAEGAVSYVDGTYRVAVAAAA
jgi:hypothetical protein